jgi:hypothetical protein
MAAEEMPAESGPESTAQRSADRLALALEDVGFDVGRTFPALRSGLDHERRPIVELGRVTATVASGLANVLSRAAHRGISLSEKSCQCGDEPGAGTAELCDQGTTLSPDVSEGEAPQ